MSYDPSFLIEINAFIQQICIKLIKNSKTFIMLQRILFQINAFELSVHRIPKKKSLVSLPKFFLIKDHDKLLRTKVFILRISVSSGQLHHNFFFF